MVIQEPLTKRLAYRSLIYAILGDKTRSEALRATMNRLNHQRAGLECRSGKDDSAKSYPGPQDTIFER